MIKIETAVWGFNYEWKSVIDLLEKHVDSYGNLSIEVFWNSLGDTLTLEWVVKELRITYSCNGNNYGLLVQEDPRPNSNGNNRRLVIDGTTGIPSLQNGRTKRNGLYFSEI